jgi:transcription initiation factor TFIIIB Brf1 subunit/transcription initiation factor TFIIB
MSLSKNICIRHPNDLQIDDYHTGDIICTTCGYVIDKNINCPENIEEINYHGWLSPGFEYIREISARLHMSDSIVFDAIYYYERCVRPRVCNNKCEKCENCIYNKLIKHRKLEELATGCIYYCAHKNNVMLGYDDVILVTGLKTKTIGASFEFMENLFGSVNKAIKPNIYASRICGWLYLPYSIEKRANILADQVFTLYKQRDPRAIMAAAIYYVAEKSKYPLNMKELEQVSNVGQSTIYLYHDLISKHF